MEYKFASRMDRMKASEIRELLKLTARPDIISFAGGLPAPELFPVKEIAQVSGIKRRPEAAAVCDYGRPSHPAGEDCQAHDGKIQNPGCGR